MKQIFLSFLLLLSGCASAIRPQEVRQEGMIRAKLEGVYDIRVDYPVLKDGSEIEKINRAIAEQVESIVQEFRDSVTQIEAPLTESTLVGTAEQGVATQGFTSLVLTFEIFKAGAAHENHLTKPINLQHRPLQLLTLRALFPKKEKEALQRISSFCREELVKRLDAEGELLSWIEQGTEPVDKNFPNFFVTNDGLTILFDPYQVAPYTVGAPRVFIPYTALSSVITAESKLFPLAAGM